MRIKTLGALSAIALAGSIGIAAAQSQPPTSPPGSTMSQGKCFDVSTNQIKERSAANQSGSPTASGARRPGDTMSGAAPSGHSAGSSATTGSATGTATPTRPPEAAGLPNC